MNTQLNSKMRRLRFDQVVVMLLVGVVALLILSSSSAQAQTATMEPPTVIMEEPAMAVDSTITVSATGSINDPNGTISISGSVTVNCRRVIDSTGASPPLVVLDFDFSKVQGSSGAGKSLKVFVNGDNHTTEIRPLQASDTIIVTAPFYESTKDALSASAWLVTASLSFDISSGRLTSGSIHVGNNVVSSATVGTISEM